MSRGEQLQQRTSFTEQEMPAPAITRLRRALAAVCLLMLCSLSAVHAQVSPTGEKQMGEPADDKLPTVLHGVDIQQHLNQQLPLRATFVDDAGKTVKLGQYFDGKHPVLLALVYYHCPILCSEELKG